MPHSLVKTSAYIMSSVYDGFAGRSNQMGLIGGSGCCFRFS